MSLIIPSSAKPFETGKDETLIQDIDTPIPDGLPEMPLWKVALMPVRQRKVSKGGIILADETLDVQNWTHQLWKVAGVGKHVYAGPAYAGFDIDPSERPQVGQLWLADAKQPRRFHYQGFLFIVVNDDQLWSRVNPEHVGKLKFNGIEL